MKFLTGLIILSLASILLVSTLDAPAAAVGENWPNSNESDGCSGLFTRTPLATKKGFLSSNERIGGPYGDMFGRTVGAIYNDTVLWVVPGSGGRTARVHERALPAFNQVTENLAIEAAKGNTYDVGIYTYAYAARTVGGSYGISRHTFGIAIDINADRNPFQEGPFEEGDPFITDMPAWYVQAWTDAGFCWGGDWKDFKDPMHFSWQGAGFTPGYGNPPDSYPVTSNPTEFSTKGYEAPTPFAETEGVHLLGDITGDGAPDAVRTYDKDGGVVIQVVSPRSDFAQCWGGSSRLDGMSVATHESIVADFAGYGRAEAGLVDETGSNVSFVLLSQRGDSETILVDTAVPVRDDQTYVVGDYNWDNHPDLYVIINSGTQTDIEIWDGANGFASILTTIEAPFGDTTNWQFALGDRDLDDRPDLYAFEPGEAETSIHIISNSGDVLESTGAFDLMSGTVTVADLDGDGADDIWFNKNGATVSGWMGSDATPNTSWIVNPAWTCPDEWTPIIYDGTFYDDDGSVFENNIEWLAAEGITLGCNPPDNDMFCPTQNVTRGQMAAFLVRALDLPPADPAGFTDTTDSLFIDPIDRLAAAGITLGCNPPDNDMFCPTQNVTRGQMAAFLVRALDLPPADPAGFTDTTDSLFIDPIDRLAAAGITLGCNPPDNDMFCPTQNVTRGQMAAFLFRALAD